MVNELLVKELAALRVGHDEVLIVRLPDTAPVERAEAVRDALWQVGLGNRAVVLLGSLEFVVCKRDPRQRPLTDEQIAEALGTSQSERVFAEDGA